MNKLVLLRHGQSTWNLENRFTGWTDVPLTEQGEKEAKEAGEHLKTGGFSFDIVHSSLLKRANDTMKICLQEMEHGEVPIYYSWQLNERHYGALQGLNKGDTAKKYGDKQVHIWRRSYTTPPPKLEYDDERHPRFDKKYDHIERSQLPSSECLKDTVERFLPYWHDEIQTDIKAGKKILIVAHGNSLRALVKYLDKKSDEEILSLNIPTGVPLVYELDQTLKPTTSYYLGDQSKIKKKAAEVAAQGISK